MQRRIIFKLRDDLDTGSIVKITNLFQVPKNYSISWSNFTEKKSQIKNDLVNKEVDSFIGLLKEAKAQLGVEPVYLFFHTPTDTFSKLRNSLADIKAEKAELETLTDEDKNYEMPVFHFAFGSEVPRGFSESVLEDILSEFEKYLPQGEANAGTSAHLLDYAYIKYENIPSAADSLPKAKGNQDYRDAIEILDLPNTNPNPPGGGAGRDLGAEETWVGIVEKWGWNTAHNSFGDLNGRVELVPGLTGDLLRELLLNQHSSDDESHGTKTLGILISQAQSDKGKGLRGILPPKVKIALSSCIVELDQAAETLYDARGFNEESALSNLIEYYSSLGLSKQVILVELATYEGFPITTEPMMAQLVEAASRLGHTVVIPAGNRINTENIDSKLGSLEAGAPYLLVGAYEPTGNNKLLVRDSTNWGKKNVKIFAQGSNVLTTHNAKRVKRLDHLTIGDNNLYDSMGYTSAASAILAGVVGRLQSYARRKANGRALFPGEMMEVLEKSKGKRVYKGDEEVGNSIDVRKAKKQVDTLLAR